MKQSVGALRRCLCLIAPLLLAGCGYDDTPNAMRVIDGETDRLLHSRVVLDAAASVSAGRRLDAARLEAVEYSYRMGQEAYVEVLRCEDQGVCRRSSLGAVCTDADALIAARRVLAPHSDLLAVHESISTGMPVDADRLRVMLAEARRDGGTSALEQDLLLMAAATAAFEEARRLTPSGRREADRRRGQWAVDEFKQRCDAR